MADTANSDVTWPLALPLQRDLPLLTSAAMRAVEAQVLATLPPGTLMQRAGAAAARLAIAVAPHANRCWIACGPGNNGGDGLECALNLVRAGRSAVVTLARPDLAPQGDAALALERARAAGVPILSGDAPALGPQDLAIDALLGIGSSRAPEGRIADAVTALNRHQGPVLALDLPTGLDADTGCLFGDVAVRATHTLTFLAAKPGLFTGHGRDTAGRVWLASLGVDEPTSAMTLTGRPPINEPRRHADHKGSFGDVVVVGGATGMTGAVWLAAGAALAAGAGRVYVSCLDASSTAPPRPEFMNAPQLTAVDPAWWSGRTVVIGCGGGSAIAAGLVATLGELLRRAARLVIDADALNAVAADPSLRRQVIQRRAKGLPTVLTPHPLEAARLLGMTTADVQERRVDLALQLARDLQAVVVLKGSGTVVADADLGAAINPTGGPALATPGSGDVLAGWIGGLWSAAARSVADPTLTTLTTVTTHTTLTAFDVARTAVWWHGAAADRITAGPLRAADLIDAIWREAGLAAGAAAGFFDRPRRPP